MPIIDMLLTSFFSKLFEYNRVRFIEQNVLAKRFEKINQQVVLVVTQRNKVHNSENEQILQALKQIVQRSSYF